MISGRAPASACAYPFLISRLDALGTAKMITATHAATMVQDLEESGHGTKYLEKSVATILRSRDLLLKLQFRNSNYPLYYANSNR